MSDSPLQDIGDIHNSGDNYGAQGVFYDSVNISTTVLINNRQEEQEFEIAYRKTVAEELDCMELFGSPRVDEIAIKQSLSVAYITLAVERNSMPQVARDAGLLSRLLTEEPTSLASDDALDRQLIRSAEQALVKHHRLVIRGFAGSGKTTLLRWLSVRAARQDFPAELGVWNKTFPFFIRLRELVVVDKQFRFPSPEDFPALIAPNQAGRMPQGWVHQRLKDGQALVLVDGVDELPRAQRTAMLQGLQRLLKDFPEAYYVITSRPAGLKDEKGKPWREWDEWAEEAKFIDLALQPMSASDIERFIEQWHTSLAATSQRERARAALAQLSKRLKIILNQRPQLRRLATTPLLCAMICALHHERGASLPTERIHLYEQCIEMLLERDRGRSVRTDLDTAYPTGLSYAQKRALIQSFAFWLMQNGYSDVETDRTDEHFHNRLRLMRLPEDVTGKQVREWFIDRANLLREPIIGRIDFLHRTFQEFLAAQATLDEGSIGLLLKHAEDDQWRETIIIAAGKARPREREELLKGLLKIGDSKLNGQHQLYLLAVACLETVVELDPAVTDEVLNRASKILPPKDADELSLVVKAGDAVVDLLAYNPSHSTKASLSCINTLARIGTYKSMVTLEGYVSDSRQEVIDAIVAAWDSFDRDDYASTILSHYNELRIKDLSSWQGFEHLKNLHSLEMSVDSSITNLEPLSNLSELKHLLLEGKSLQDPGSITNLSSLVSLDIHKTGMSDISVVSSLPMLDTLTINGASLRKPNWLTKLTNISNLTIKGTMKCNFNVFANLPNISSLTVFKTGLNRIDETIALVHIERLFVYGESLIRNTNVFLSFPNLIELRILDSDITDITSVANLHRVTSLTFHKAAIHDLEPLRHLTELCHLEIVGTAVRDLRPLSGLTNLKTLIIHGAGVRDLSPLANLSNLTELQLHFTEVLDLKPIHGLIGQLRISGDPMIEERWSSMRGQLRKTF